MDRKKEEIYSFADKVLDIPTETGVSITKVKDLPASDVLKFIKENSDRFYSDTRGRLVMDARPIRGSNFSKILSFLVSEDIPISRAPTGALKLVEKLRNSGFDHFGQREKERKRMRKRYTV